LKQLNGPHRRAFLSSIALPILFGRCAVGQVSGRLTLPMPQWCSRASQVASTDFGLVGDDATDNTQQLEVLRQYLVQHDHTVVNFAAGQYRYTNFEWLHGVRNVMLRGVGSVGLRNVIKNPWDIRRVTLMANADMLTGPESIPEMGIAPTYLVDAANAGDRTLHLLSPSRIADIEPGTPILISGYNQYNGGWPPCLRFSEFATVTAVNWDQGLITLDAPLVHSYQSHWPGQLFRGHAFGPATIVSLQRKGTSQFQLGEHHIFENITFLATPEGPAYTNRNGLGGLYTMGVRFFEMRNCRMFFFGPNENQWVKVTNCDINTTELGKMVGAIEILDSLIGNMTQATAVELLIMRRCTFSTLISIAPTRLIMTGNTIASSRFGRQMGLGTLSSNTHVDTAFIANNTFAMPQGTPTVSLVSISPPNAITPVGLSPSGIVIPASSWAWLGSASVGSRLFHSSGANAVIADVVAAGDKIEVRTSVPAFAATKGPLSVRCVRDLIFFGNTVIGGTPAKQVEDPSRVEQLITSGMTEQGAFAADSVNLGHALAVC